MQQAYSWNNQHKQITNLREPSNNAGNFTQTQGIRPQENTKRKKPSNKAANFTRMQVIPQENAKRKKPKMKKSQQHSNNKTARIWGNPHGQKKQ